MGNLLNIGRASVRRFCQWQLTCGLGVDGLVHLTIHHRALCSWHRCSRNSGLCCSKASTAFCFSLSQDGQLQTQDKVLSVQPSQRTETAGTRGIEVARTRLYYRTCEAARATSPFPQAQTMASIFPMSAQSGCFGSERSNLFLPASAQRESVSRALAPSTT